MTSTDIREVLNGEKEMKEKMTESKDNGFNKVRKIFEKNMKKHDISKGSAEFFRPSEYFKKNIESEPDQNGVFFAVIDGSEIYAEMYGRERGRESKFARDLFADLYAAGYETGYSENPVYLAIVPSKNMKETMKIIDLESIGMTESDLTGEKLRIGDQVIAEVDVRHFSPPGWSTFKFMDPDKAAEFASQWAAKGGAVVAGQEAIDNELVGSRNLYYIYAGPLQSFYGESKNESCECGGSCGCSLGLTKKPKYKEKMKKSEKHLASQGSFSDFYEATEKKNIIKIETPGHQR